MIVSLTLVSGATMVPGFGACLATLPRFAVEPLRLVTLPDPQPAALSLFFAAFSFLPLSFGTLQPS